MGQFVGRKWINRGLLLVAALAVITVGVTTLTTTPTAQAASRPGVRTYYSSSTYTTQVGREVFGCCGEYSLTGSKTKWSKFEGFYCTDQLCPN